MLQFWRNDCSKLEIHTYQKGLGAGNMRFCFLKIRQGTATFVQKPVTNEQAGAALDLHIHDAFVSFFLCVLE